MSPFRKGALRQLKSTHLPKKPLLFFVIAFKAMKNYWRVTNYMSTLVLLQICYSYPEVSATSMLTWNRLHYQWQCGGISNHAIGSLLSVPFNRVLSDIFQALRTYGTGLYVPGVVLLAYTTQSGRVCVSLYAGLIFSGLKYSGRADITASRIFHW